MSFDFRHLRYLVAIAQNLSFNRAAEQLHVAQSALSTQIQDLEKSLGVKLIDRSNKQRIKLTLAGQEFFQEAKLILAQVEEAINIARRANRGEVGCLNLGFNSSVTNSILPNALKGFRHQFPDVELIFQEGTAHSLIKGLHTQQLDLGLMHWSKLNPPDESLEIQQIKEESFLLVLPENHPLAHQEIISLASLVNESFILPPSSLPYSIYEPIVSFWKQVEFMPKEIKEATFMLTILSLVAGEMGVSLLPANVENIQRQGVIYRSIAEQIPTLQIVASWRKDNESLILQNFLVCLRQSSQ